MVESTTKSLESEKRATQEEGNEDTKSDKGNEEDFETNWELEVNKFDDMGLKDHVLRGIYGYGFVEPSPIQQKGVLPVI